MRLTPKMLQCLIRTSHAVRVRIPSAKCCTLVFDEFELVNDDTLRLHFKNGDQETMDFLLSDILRCTPEVDGGIVKSVSSDSNEIVYELTFLSLQQTRIMPSWLESESELEPPHLKFSGGGSIQKIK